MKFTTYKKWYVSWYRQNGPREPGAWFSLPYFQPSGGERGRGVSSWDYLR
ncbi:MAG TPA: hypothetical protein VMT63_02505 [Bacteroidales bacterium]|nr:hypothetical protein [Bacteroidales bacterium]